MRGSNPLWAPFYDSGETRLDADGSLEADPDHPPFFRFSQELLGRMLHTFKRKYVDSDEQRKTDEALSGRIEATVIRAKNAVSEAGDVIKERQRERMRKHEELMAASHEHMAEASRLYKEAVDKHVASLLMSVQGTTSLTLTLTLTRFSNHVLFQNSSWMKELGFVKQLKELQEEHRILHLRYDEQLQASKRGTVEQLRSAREVNREASQVIADLEEKIKNLGQDKLGLELQQVKLEKEVETLKRKRRDIPSPPPADSASKIRILRRGEDEPVKPLEVSLSPSSHPPPKKSRNRSKRWDQPAPGQEQKGPSPARTPENVNGKRLQEQGIKDDPVLYASLNSFRNKRDVEEEICMSSKTLGHGSKGSEEVFHRLTLPH